jgi:hypothetical protein
LLQLRAYLCSIPATSTAYAIELQQKAQDPKGKTVHYPLGNQAIVADLCQLISIKWHISQSFS